jgi:hypothetical protein
MFLLMLTGTSSAGLFSGSLSAKDAAGVHKIAVISMLGDTLHFDTMALTAFGNKRYQASVPQWEMDAAVTEHTVQELKEHGHFSAEVLQLASAKVGWQEFAGLVGLSSDGRKAILRQAEAQGADTVLLIVRETNAHESSISAGFGLWNRHVLGKDHIYLMASFSLLLIRVDGDKVLAQQHPDPLIQSAMAGPMKASWSDYTPEGQAGLESALKQRIFTMLDGALTSLSLTTSAPH